ncbi:MAG: hypothetical protein KIT09_22425 [Bryobacteraceae bacterium]|nr:hypothetical protein [Bryobacteraceae bacterium]
MKLSRAFVFLLILFPSLGPSADPSAAVDLSPSLAEWKRQIEETGSGKLILARIYTDVEQNRIVIPADAEQRRVLIRYFLNPAFVDEFVEMHAANLNHSGPEGSLHFILLNMARAAEWGEHEEAVLGHEFGHVWLHATGYPFPVYEGGADSCVSIQAGDAVQHVVIRAEMDRRGIVYRHYWTANLERLLDAIEGGGVAPATALPVCRAAAQVVLWLDARLGLTPESWDRYDDLIAALDRSFPELKSEVDALEALIRGRDVAEPAAHLEVLRQALVEMYRFFARWPPPEDTPQSAENKGN